MAEVKVKEYSSRELVDTIANDDQIKFFNVATGKVEKITSENLMAGSEATTLNTTHRTENDGSDHSFIDQDVTSGSAPAFTADNLSDGGGNAIITTTQETNFETAYNASHARSHSLVSTDDHTSTATADQMLKADVNGLPVDATNTDTEISGAVSASHTQNTDTKIIVGDTEIAITDTGTDGKQNFKVDGVDQMNLVDGVLAPETTNDIDLGDATHLYKDVYITGNLSDGTNTGTVANLKTAIDHVGLTTGNPHLVTKTEVGLSNVPNTDCTNASNITTGILSSAVLPPVAMTSVQVAVDEAAQLALTTEEGDVVVRSDENKSYMHNGGSAGTMADFTELQTPTDSVLSVNTKTGTVVINPDDLSDELTTNKFVTANDITKLGDLSNTNSGDDAVNSNYSGLVSNVTTNLSEGESTATTVKVVSSDGTDATLVSASTTRAGLLTKAKYDEIVANTSKVGVTTEIKNVVEDTTPQQGGDLDGQRNYLLNNQSITNLASKGAGYYLNGTNTKLTLNGDIENSTLFETGNSVEFIISANSMLTTSNRIFDKVASSFASPGGITAGLYNIRLTVGFSTTNGSWTTGSIFPIDEDVHLILTYDASSVSNNAILYYNGKSVALSVSTPVGTITSTTGNELVIGNRSGSDRGWSGNFHKIRIFNNILTATEVKDLYSNANIPFKYEGASNTALTSGSLVVGKEYIIDTFVDGDDFVNVGGTNVTGTVFTATGTTPTAWTNSSSLRTQGNVADYNSSGITDATWFDASGNGNDGTNSGATVVNKQISHAENVDIVDAGSIITATQVEAALQENRTAINLNTSKETNATHTGQVTGDGALTVDKIAITGQGVVTADGTDYVLLSDTSDTGKLKKALISDFAAAGGDMTAATYDPDSIAGNVFDMANMRVKGASTGNTTIASANTSASDYVATLQAATGTVAFTSDITGTNSGTNTGDDKTAITGILKGDGTDVSQATSGTDYLAPFDENLTVNTGALTLTANADDSSVLTIGSGAISVSGANTGDELPSQAGNSGKFLTTDGTDPSWASTGDMVLADAQSNTGIKTFDKGTLKVKGTSTGSTDLSTANASATSYTATLQAKTGTVAFTSDITGTNSGTNTGDDSVNSNYSGLVTNATHTGDVTGDGELTIAAEAVTYAKMQNVSATNKILGRSTAEAGNVEEITCTAAGRAILDDADAAAQRNTLSAAGKGANSDITSLTGLTAPILLDTTPASDVSGNGFKGVFTNGNAGAVAFGDVCFMASDGALEFADADQITTMPGLYMALETISAAGSGEWLMLGVARNDSWNWTIGAGTLGLIYVSVTATTGNTLTQTAPSATGDQVQIVGHALSADVMMFNPNYTYIEVA